MDWLISRYNTALEALTAKRTLLVGSVVTACGIVGAWLPQIEWNGKQMFLGIPTWTWWVIVALSALLGIAFEYAHRTRIVLAPKIKTSFDQNDGGVVHTPTKFKDLQGQTISETTAAYVRIKVEASSALGVKECSAYLTGIEKYNEGRFVPIALSNSILLTDPTIYVPSRVPRTIDFLKSSATDNLLRLTAAWPLTLRNAFDQHTTYRFKIAVVAEHLTSEIYVDVVWAGKWDAITAKQHFPPNKKAAD
jgi:hypothetical protein